MTYAPLVLIDQNQVDVTVDLKAPTVTITNNITQEVTVVCAASSAVVGTQKPRVNVYLGGIADYTNAEILTLLTASLTRAQLGASLTTELDATIISLDQYSDSIIALNNDVSSHTTEFGIVNGNISSIVADLLVVDGRLNVNETTITQNSANITLHAGRLTGHDNDIASAQASIQINAGAIALNVASINSANGIISQNTADIIASAAQISLAVGRITATENSIIAQSASIQLNADAILLAVSGINDQEDRLVQTELQVTAHGLVVSTMDAKVSVVTSAMAGKWFVQMEEDTGGSFYSTGFQLILHVDWDYNAHAYIINNMVWYAGQAWICILGHTSDVTTYPQAGAPGSTYWSLVVNEDKSAFIVHVDAFKVQNTVGDSIITPFKVVGSVVTIDGSLIADTIQSSNYVSNTSGFSINIDTGLAEFIDMNLVIGNENVIISPITDSIIVAPDGGVTGNDYAELKYGDLYFYLWNGSDHIQYKNIFRLEVGVALSNTLVSIPGYFKETPTIIIAPKEIQTYQATSSGVDQILQINTPGAVETIPGSQEWEFTSQIELVTSSGLILTDIPDPPDCYTYYGGPIANPATTIGTPTFTTGINTNSIRFFGNYLVGSNGVSGNWQCKIIANIDTVDHVVYDTGIQPATTHNLSGNFNTTIEGLSSSTHDVYYKLWAWNANHPSGSSYTKMLSGWCESIVSGGGVLATGTINWIAIGR